MVEVLVAKDDEVVEAFLLRFRVILLARKKCPLTIENSLIHQLRPPKDRWGSNSPFS